MTCLEERCKPPSPFVIRDRGVFVFGELRREQLGLGDPRHQHAPEGGWAPGRGRDGRHDQELLMKVPF